MRPAGAGRQRRVVPRRPGRGAVVLAALAAVGSVHASPLDWACGSTDLLRGAVADPADGLRAVAPLGARAVERGALSYGFGNEVPLIFRRAGAHAGRVETKTHRLGLDLTWPRVELSARRRDSQTTGDLVERGFPHQALWREREWSLRVAGEPGDHWRLAAGFDRGSHDVHYVTTDPSYRPSSGNDYDGGFVTNRLWTAVATTHGPLRGGLGAAWRWQDGWVGGRVGSRPASAPLDETGWQLAALLQGQVAKGWQVELAGNYRTQTESGHLQIGNNRYGRSRPGYEEWRLGLEARGPVGRGLEWWGTVFHRSVRAELAGHASAIAPPLGTLVGPRYRLISSAYWRQAGLATGVAWRPAPRTEFGFALRSSWGRGRADYQVTEQSGPTATPTEASASRFDRDVWLGVLAVQAEQRLGTVTVGAGTALAVATTADRLPPGPPPVEPGPPGLRTELNVPFEFWLRTVW